MKFRLFRPKIPGRVVLEEIFSKFTPEEIALLDKKVAVIPFMYSLMMMHADDYYTRRTMEDVKRVAEQYIYPLRGKLGDKESHIQIFKVLYFGIFSNKKSIY